MDSRILFICPTYAEVEHHRYTLRAVRSFLRYTPDGSVLVVDDASPGWHTGHERDLVNEDKQRVFTARFEVWGGVTRSWNFGLNTARGMNLEFALCGNNDVVFTDGWYEGMVQALDQGFSLAGPVSNAPGITAQKQAEVWRYVGNYELRDDQPYLDSVARSLRGLAPFEAPVNGFCQLARTRDWWSGAYDDRYVYRPSNEFTSEGRRNPTPLMTLNEDELQGRWAKLGRRTAVCPSSFVFHYRAVTRGSKYFRGRWYRPADPLLNA